ncbi:MAG TPA: hypothetical protein VNZ48_04135 [Xanthobacteraceae bacterium]|jgi:hypothetical protein|nr:hypothetical protein [Xanthobacteraceae bacterium]
MIDVLAASDPAKNLAFLIMPVVWNEHRDRSADRLRGAVSEQPFRASVPAGNDALEGFGEDRVVGEPDDRGKPLRGFERLSDIDVVAECGLPYLAEEA